MAVANRRQRPRRLACWALVAVVLADLLALSGKYSAKESKELASDEEGVRLLARSLLELLEPGFVLLSLYYLLPPQSYMFAIESPEGLVIDNPVFSLDTVAVMSVDLGSESMKVAIVKPGVPMEIVLNK